MKITMYELYGKIYNENPPKHIRVYGEDWYWNDYDGYVTKESLKTTPDAQWYLMDRYRTFMNLDQEVEILEEKEICHKCHKYPAEYNQTYCEFCLGISKLEEENKIPEKLEIYKITDETISGLRITLNVLNEDIASKINEIIDYLKSKGDE